MNVADIRDKKHVSYLHESINQRLVFSKKVHISKYVFTCGKCGFFRGLL